MIRLIELVPDKNVSTMHPPPFLPHQVPADNPAASIEMLRQVTEFDKREITTE